MCTGLRVDMIAMKRLFFSEPERGQPCPPANRTNMEIAGRQGWRAVHGFLFSILIVLAPVAVYADAVSRFGSGATVGDIQSVVDGFRSDLGGTNNGVGGGPFGSGFRAINWDGVPDNVAAGNPLPPAFFNSTSPRGVTFATAGTGFQVSANAASGVPVRFGNIDPSYSTTFQAFSQERLFTALGSTVVDVNFFLPSSPTTPAFTRGFGAVFGDVDQSDSTSISFFDANNSELYTLFVPPANGGFSFAGVTFDGGEQVTRVRILSGNAALGAGVFDGGLNDLVVMDDFFYGEPMVVPEPSVFTFLVVGGIALFLSWRKSRKLTTDN